MILAMQKSIKKPGIKPGLYLF